MKSLASATPIGAGVPVDATPAIRRASEADAPLLADVLEMAGRGHLERGPWELIFPDDVERRRALEWIATRGPVSWCHRSLFHLAEADGRAAAGLVCFDPAELGDTSLAAPLFDSFAMLGWSEEKSMDVAPRLAPYVACFPDMPPGTWIVENVGTREDARRRGLVRALLDHALELGRSRGCRRAQISCLIGNTAAQRAYERAGFEVSETLESPAFEALVGSPGFLRMTRDLG